MASLDCCATKAKFAPPAGEGAVVCCEGVAPKDKPGWLLAAAAMLAGGCWPKPTVGGAGAAEGAAGPEVALAGSEAPKLRAPGVEAAPAVAAGAAAVAGKAAEAGLAAGTDPVTWPLKPLNAAALPAAGAAAVLLPPPKEKVGAGIDAVGALDAAAVLVSVPLDPNPAAADVRAGAVSVMEATAAGPAPPGAADALPESKAGDGPDAGVGREGVGGTADPGAPKLKPPRGAEVACPLD